MIQNTARPRGRPRSFDETEALEKATQVFWSKGYDGVTIDDLVAGMGVGRPSLYAVFGDKRAIFLRVLKAYAERKGASAAKALLSPQGLRDSIAAFLRYAVESATEKGSAPGCLLVCVAPLVNDAEVRKFLQNAAAGGAALVEGRFRDGITAGEIPSDFPVAVRAIQVTDFARGLTMRAQIGTPRKTLLRDAEEAADLVLLSAAWKCGAKTLMLDGVKVGASKLRSAPRSHHRRGASPSHHRHQRHPPLDRCEQLALSEFAGSWDKSSIVSVPASPWPG